MVHDGTPIAPPPSQAEKMEHPLKRRTLSPLSSELWQGVTRLKRTYHLTWRAFFECLLENSDRLLPWMKAKSSPITKDVLLNRLTLNGLMKRWMENLSETFSIVKSGLDVEILPKTTRSAIVIGAGPSVDEYRHLELLARSGYKGIIITTDRMLRPCLDAGVIPDYVTTVDGSEKIAPFYTIQDHPRAEEAYRRTTAVLSSTVHPSVIQLWTGRTVFYHAALDDPYADEFTATRMLYYLVPHTVLQAGGNCGAFSWFLAIYLQANPIALIGLDFSFLPRTPLEQTPYWTSYMGGYNEEYIRQHLFRRELHPVFKTERTTDYVFESYAEGFTALVDRARKEDGIRTINCTGAGLLRPPAFECMHFGDFLEQDPNLTARSRRYTITPAPMTPKVIIIPAEEQEAAANAAPS